VAGIIESGLDAVAERDSLSVLDRREERETSLSVFGSIKRDFGIRTFSALLFVSFAFMRGVFFLYLGGIQKNNPGKVGGSGGAIYPAIETFFNEFGQKATMVEMGVGQKDGIDAGRRDGKRVPVSFSEVPFLIKAAVYKKADAISFEQMARTGNVLSGTEKP
jgi:hypothetical protein